MQNLTKEYFLPLIASIEIAQEIIETSVMSDETRRNFKTLMENQQSDEDWTLLQNRLAGWLVNWHNNNAATF